MSTDSYDDGDDGDDSRIPLHDGKHLPSYVKLFY